MILVSFSRIKAFDEWNFCEKNLLEIIKTVDELKSSSLLPCTLSLLAPEIYIYLLTYLQAAVL